MRHDNRALPRLPFPQRPVASALAQTAKEPHAQTAKEPQLKQLKSLSPRRRSFLSLMLQRCQSSRRYRLAAMRTGWPLVLARCGLRSPRTTKWCAWTGANVVQARIEVDKEPCYGIGIGVDRVWVLNCQGKTLTRINPKTNAVDMRVPVKIDDSGEGSIAVDERYVWFASNEDGHASTLSQVEVKTGRKLKGIAVGKIPAWSSWRLGRCGRSARGRERLPG